MEYIRYSAPQPLEKLWWRPDLGCTFMCGYPIAQVQPLAAPIPDADGAHNWAVYRSDLMVSEDVPFETLADTFAGTAWLDG